MSAASSVHYITSCNTQSSAPEDGRNYRPKHVEVNGIINKPLLLHLVGCLYCNIYAHSAQTCAECNLRPSFPTVTVTLRRGMSVNTFPTFPSSQEWVHCKCKVHPCTGTEALYRPYGP